ncbi:MAG TPA: LuxR C-terminal-related transcriptional regulator [Micromonosporaceae bacterium]|jgi:DNA-binding NarL/FixJ family response regulator
MACRRRAAPYGLTPRDGHARGRRPGLTNTEIGRRLFISESTVSVHVTNIPRKLALNNRAQAVALA